MGIQIVVDSTVDLVPELRARVRAVPLCIRFGEKEYFDGVTIQPETFYRMLEEDRDLPTTSQPTPAAFEDVFREVVEAGDDVLCITVASQLSGTYQSATIASQEFPGRVFLVDSGTAAISSGILAEQAVQWMDAGWDIEQIWRELNAVKSRVRLYAIVDTLEYLKRGGRLSSAAALVGGMLNIKPVIGIEDGQIKVVGTARGMKKAYAVLSGLASDHGGVDKSRPFQLGYTGQSGEQLRRYMEENQELWGPDTRTTIVSPTIGVHAGPGAVALAFFSRE